MSLFAAVLSKTQQIKTVVDDIYTVVTTPASMTVVNSIQKGSIVITIPAGTANKYNTSSNTSTITAVTTSKSFVIFNGMTSTVATTVSNVDTTASVELTNTTTVTAHASQCRSTGAGTVTVYFTVVEYK